MPATHTVEPAPHSFRPKVVAHMIGTTEATLAWWRCRGGGPEYFKRGRAVFYTAAAVQKFADEMRGPFRITADDAVTIRANAARGVAA